MATHVHMHIWYTLTHNIQITRISTCIYRSDCIGSGHICLTFGGEAIEHETGKMCLRQAFATVASWRRKVWIWICCSALLCVAVFFSVLQCVTAKVSMASVCDCGITGDVTYINIHVVYTYGYIYKNHDKIPPKISILYTGKMSLRQAFKIVTS